MSENTPYHKALPVPRQYSFVKYDVSNLPAMYQKQYQDGMLVFSPTCRYIFLGVVPNMEGHCIVTDDDGKLYVGYHIENFIELTDDELDHFGPVGYLPR